MKAEDDTGGFFKRYASPSPCPAETHAQPCRPIHWHTHSSSNAQPPRTPPHSKSEPWREQVVRVRVHVSAETTEAEVLERIRRSHELGADNGLPRPVEVGWRCVC